MQTLPVVSQPKGRRKPARLGQINFINSLPVVIPINRLCNSLQAQIILGTPSELNRQYAQDKLDLGAMSSFFFLECGDMQLVDGLSISSVGPVGSVLFFSKQHPSKLNNCQVAVPQSSATSINLLRILLQEQFGVKPLFVHSDKPDLEDEDIEAALVIGDRALLVDAAWSNKFERFDMGEWWHGNYHLPMIFGVWAAKNNWVGKSKELFEELSAALVQARVQGLSTDFNAVIAESMKRLPLSRARLEKYFLHELNFEFGAKHEQGLSLYRDLCHKYQLFHAADPNSNSNELISA